MASGLPARWAIVCVGLVIAGVAHADKHEVAVVDLSEDAAAQDLTTAIYGELGRQPDLEGLWRRRDLDNLLVGALFDEDGDAIKSAKGAKADGEAALAAFKFDDAKTSALAGEKALYQVVPTADTIALFADLSLIVGQAQFATRGGGNAANQAFELTHRLDPGRKLDAAVYLPETLAAFDAAAATTPAKAQLAVKGTGRLWVDGVERGTAPAMLEVSFGQHLVQLTGADRETAGKLVVVSGVTAVDLDDAPASDTLLIKRARTALAHAVDPAARAGAMQQLAGLLGVHDAVLISKTAEGKLLVQTWRDRAPGFSALREHGDENPSELLEPLVPPRAPEPVHEPVPPPQLVFPRMPVEQEPAWYQKRWVQASVAGGVVLAVVSAILVAREIHHIPIGGDIKDAM